MRRGLLTGVIGTVAALAVVPQAFASTVTITGGGTVRVLESGDQANRIAIGYDAVSGAYRVADAAAALTPSGSCAAIDAHTATCPGAGIRTISVDTGARDDTISVDAPGIPGNVTEDLDGGDGSDQVGGGRGTVQGGPGNDVVVGSPFAENIRGGSGRDTLDGGDGPDDIQGGSGSDTLVYPAGRTTPIVVTIGAGDSNDGGVEDEGAGGRDTVHGDVEALVGTIQDDVLVGDGSGETLNGFAGNDTLIGNDGNDALLGLNGDDVLVGGRGRDLLIGWLGADRLFGGPGNDRVKGGPDDDFLVGNLGHDVIKGKSGIDAIRAKDGTRDVKISCGQGSNRAESARWDKRRDPHPRSC
jgi:Ca2+-binding RTX toxin-like protein